MEKYYEVSLYEQIKLWKYLIVKVKAKNKEEAKEKALKLDVEDFIENDYLFETEETLKTEFSNLDNYIKEIK